MWYAVTETCLAFTVFRDDFSPKFIALFTFLLFLKSFHWLAEDRVDYVSRQMYRGLNIRHIFIFLVLTIFNYVPVYFNNLSSLLFRWKEVQ